MLDFLIIGGGMTYTFVKAMGGNIGNSLVENDKLELALEIIKLAKEKNIFVIEDNAQDMLGIYKKRISKSK